MGLKEQKTIFNELYKEKNLRLENGLSIIDVSILFENKLLKLIRDKEDKGSDEYIALKTFLNFMRKECCKVVYKANGWFLNEEGEWMKVTNLNDDVNNMVELYRLIPPGWWSIMDEYVPQLLDIDPGCEIFPKEKYGVLYLTVLPRKKEVTQQAFKDIYEKVKIRSGKTCEICGNPGYLYNDEVWEQTLCIRCQQLTLEERTNAKLLLVQNLIKGMLNARNVSR